MVECWGNEANEHEESDFCHILQEFTMCPTKYYVLLLTLHSPTNVPCGKVIIKAFSWTLASLFLFFGMTLDWFFRFCEASSQAVFQFCLKIETLKKVLVVHVFDNVTHIFTLCQHLVLVGTLHYLLVVALSHILMLHLNLAIFKSGYTLCSFVAPIIAPMACSIILSCLQALLVAHHL